MASIVVSGTHKEKESERRDSFGRYLRTTTTKRRDRVRAMSDDTRAGLFSRDPHKKDWAEAIQFFKDEHGVDLSDMDYKIQDTPIYTNGMPARMDPLLSAGSHTNLGWIRLATPKHQTRVQKHYQEKFPGSGPLIPQGQFSRSMMAHELAHEAWLRMPDEATKRYATSEFTSGFIRALPADHKKLVSGEERFAETAGHRFADDHVWRAQADRERAAAAEAGIDIRPEEYLSRRAQRLAEIEAERENQLERIRWEAVKSAKAAAYEARVAAADLKYPVLTREGPNGLRELLDGSHRYEKAQRTGVQINEAVVPEELLDQAVASEEVDGMQYAPVGDKMIDIAALHKLVGELKVAPLDESKLQIKKTASDTFWGGFGDELEKTTAHAGYDAGVRRAKNENQK